MQYGTAPTPMPTIPGQGSADQGRPMPGGPTGQGRMLLPPPTPIPDLAGQDLQMGQAGLEEDFGPPDQGQNPMAQLIPLLLMLMGQSGGANVSDAEADRAQRRIPRVETSEDFRLPGQ